MPAAFEIDHVQRRVNSRAWGVLEDADLWSTQRGVAADPRFDPMYSQLYDFTAVTEVRLTGSYLRDLALYSPFARNARRAVVVGTDEAFGMARMFEMVSDRAPEAFRIFRDRAEAVRWLEGAVEDVE